MTLWYDVSDLMDWPLSHLTGIQRSVIGILNGFHELEIYPNLICFDIKKFTFRTVKISDLPAVVRLHIHIADKSLSDSEINKKPNQFKEKLKEVLGDDPIGHDIFTNLRDINSAGRLLRKNLYQWLKTRMSGGNNSNVDPGYTNQISSLPDDILYHRDGDTDKNNVLLSCCASWTISGHVAAVGSLRQKGVKVVRMIYDLIPVLKPQWVVEKDEKIFSSWAQSLLRESDLILTISEFSKMEIKRYCKLFDIKKPALKVVRLGDVLNNQENVPSFKSNSSRSTSKLIPNRPFFLCVSTLDVRKNHRLLYDAWSLMTSRDPDNCPDLVCIGTKHYFVDDLIREIQRTPAVNSRIYLLKDVGDKDLNWYYKNCVATIYPSRYEGWGLPVAESLGHGRLCLASNATSIPEISSELPAFFDPLNVYELIDLIDRCMQDKEWLKQKEAKIRSNFNPTPWIYTAHQIMNAL